jgi:hypothetical protein
MCKHCKDEKNNAIECMCNCSDSEWAECESEKNTIQEEVAWLKCKDCNHYLFLKAISEKILVAREVRSGEYPMFRHEETPYFIPGPVPRISA